jgi:uncharacterized LabA/DUF88 family protein
MMEHQGAKALFIDAGYLERVRVDVFGVPSGGRKVPFPLDYKRLPAMLAGGAINKIFYYDCLPYVQEPPLPAEYALMEGRQKFWDFLARQKGWIIRQGRLEARGPKGAVWYTQKRVDVMLAVDLTRLAWRQEIKEAVLLAGDSDFVPLIEDAKSAGVKIRLRYAPGTAHEDLVRACHEAVPLTLSQLEGIKRA